MSIYSGFVGVVYVFLNGTLYTNFPLILYEKSGGICLAKSLTLLGHRSIKTTEIYAIIREFRCEIGHINSDFIDVEIFNL